MTINEKQAVINNKVEELYEEYCHQFQPWAQNTVTERLRTCTAYVYKDRNGYIALRSYNTFVAFITPNGDFVDILRLVYGYTAISAQHIGKFYHDYAGNCKKLLHLSSYQQVTKLSSSCAIKSCHYYLLYQHHN